MMVNIGIPEEQVTKPVLDAGLEPVTRLNEALIREGKAPDFHAQIAKGNRWAPEPPGQESFDHAGTIDKRGWGDCDDWAPLHAATLRVTRVDPGARAVVFQSGPHRWHAVTKRTTGTVPYQDPSQTAGMRVRRGSAAAGIPPAVTASMAAGGAVLGGVADTRPFIAVRQDPRTKVWQSRTDLPFARGPLAGLGHVLAVRHEARTPARALAGSLLGATLLGGCSGVTDRRHLDRLYALSGLLRGTSARKLAGIVGADSTKEAVKTLAEICPQILDELREHRRAVEEREEVGRHRHGHQRRSPPVTSWPAGVQASMRRHPPAPPPPPGNGGGGDGGGGDGGDGGDPDDGGDGSDGSDVNGRGRRRSILRGADDDGLSDRAAVLVDSAPFDLESNRILYVLHRYELAAADEAILEQRLRRAQGQKHLAHRAESLAGGRPGARRRMGYGVRGYGACDLNYERLYNRAMGCDGGASVGHGLNLMHLVTDVLKHPDHILREAGRIIKDPIRALRDAKQVIVAASKLVPGVLGVVQGIVSLVPGIGPGISSAMGAAMSLIGGGSPIEIALNAALGLIPMPPGLNQLAKTVLDAILKVIETKNVGEAAILAVKQQIPAGFLQQVFDTLAHIVLHFFERKKPTHAMVVRAPNGTTQVVPLTKAEHFHNLHAIAPSPIMAHPPAPRPAPPAPRPAPPAPRPAAPRATATPGDGSWVYP